MPNILKTAGQAIFPKQLQLGVFFLNLFGHKTRNKRLMKAFKHYPKGTIGREIWEMLYSKGYQLVPWYETHDMKHLILGYRQEPADEIRMQAFMFGNAGFSAFTVFTFAIFAIWTPEAWRDLPYHYQLGKHTRPISNWDIITFAHKSVHDLRIEIGLEAAKEKVKRYRNLV